MKTRSTDKTIKGEEYMVITGGDVFLIDYDTQTLFLIWRGENFKLDLKEGDVGDFWHSIQTNDGTVFDINFHQEDELQEPSVDIYDLKEDATGAMWTADNIANVSEAWRRGNPNNYFNRILPSDYSIKKEVTRVEYEVTLFHKRFRVITEDFHDKDGVTIWQVEELATGSNGPSLLDEQVHELMTNLLKEGKL